MTNTSNVVLNQCEQPNLRIVKPISIHKTHRHLKPIVRQKFNGMGLIIVNTIIAVLTGDLSASAIGIILGLFLLFSPKYLFYKQIKKVNI